ncbi:MAG: hypothetical protein JW881_16730 [Spirochaetales bacterium]|nr:hypothetical protein [Spirochaetales bacterium]
MDKMRRIIYAGMIAVLTIMGVLACKTSGGAEPFVLEELFPENDKPAEKSAGDKPVEKESSEPVPTRAPKVLSGKILEVHYKRGKAVSIYIGLGSSTKGIRRNLEGTIYNDMAKTEEIGRVKLTEVFPNMSLGEIIALTHEISKKDGVVAFEID